MNFKFSNGRFISHLDPFRSDLYAWKLSLLNRTKDQPLPVPKWEDLNDVKVGDGASISYGSLSGPIIKSSYRDDISETDRSRAAAESGVSAMPRSFSVWRVLCVILKTSLVTASAQQSFKLRWRLMRLLICGSKPASFITSADVGNDSLKRGNAVESKNFTPHVRGIGKYSRSSQVLLVTWLNEMFFKFLQSLKMVTRHFTVCSSTGTEMLTKLRNFIQNSLVDELVEWDGVEVIHMSYNTPTWSSQHRFKRVM